MPVPTVITDLSTTAASNYPAGTDSPSVLDDVQRAHAGFIRQLYNGDTALYTPAGTGAVATTVQAKLRQVIDAADYIASPGTSNALDQAGVQAAVNQAAVNGGRVRIRKPISNAWSLSLITIPSNVIIDDERFIDSGHTTVFGTGTDVEQRLHGTSTSAGEGPSFVGVNNATTGDRTVSLVARYGPGAGSNVNCYMHMGVWDGANWFPEFDQITSGASGFRSNWRVGYGTAQLNAGITGAAAYTAGKVLIVNRPVGMGAGGMAFEVGNTISKFNTELKIQVANAPLRFCAADGTPNWTFLDQYPSAGQFTLYDHNTSANKIVFTSAGDTVHLGVFKPSTDNTVSIGTAANRWSVVYAGTGAINTSDARQKQRVRTLTDAEHAVAVRCKGLLRAFKFNDAVDKKGDKARIHFGVLAQDVKAAFEAEGLVAEDYAAFCYDEWGDEFVDHQPEYRDSEILGPDGEQQRVLIKDAWREKVRSAGNRYGVRYEQLLAFIIAAL